MNKYDFDDRADYDGNGHVDDFEKCLYFLEMEEEDRMIESGKGVFNGAGFGSQKRSERGQALLYVVCAILLIYSICRAFA